MSTELTTTEVALPAVGGFTAPMLQALTDALGIDREVLATDEHIQNAWQNLPQLLSSIPPEQLGIWCDRIAQTFDAQREAIIKMLHGIYCDPSKEEHARVTAITVCRKFVTTFTPAIVSELINQHQRYQAKGQQEHFNASQAFFEGLGQLGILSETERHAMISSACKNLMGVHNAMNNFYNERPFAEHLANLSRGHQIPKTVRFEFVEAIVTCSVGNEYGAGKQVMYVY